MTASDRHVVLGEQLREVNELQAKLAESERLRALLLNENLMARVLIEQEAELAQLDALARAFALLDRHPDHDVAALAIRAIVYLQSKRT